jgi:hypothetical protein
MSKKARNMSAFDRSCPSGKSYATKEEAEAVSPTGRAIHCQRGRHWHVDKKRRKGDRTVRRRHLD